MAKDKLTDYSATNSLNTDVGSINIDEGMLPSDVNNAIREVMTHLKDFAEGTQAVNSISVTGNVSMGSASTTGNITFGDNDKAIFGAGSDLQIYHDGADSYINDAGTGDLKLGGNQLQLNNAAQTKNYIYAVDGAQVELKYDNSKKLETTSGGIDVTGTVTASSGFAMGNDDQISSTGNMYIDVDSNNDSTSSSLHLTRDGKTKTTAKFQETGDISFYADNGISQSFYWDASTQRLGLGTTNPSYGQLTLYKDGANDTKLALANNGNGGGTVAWTLKNDTAWDLTLSHNAGIGGQNLIFGTKTSGGESMRITSGGNVGIGTAAPVGKFTVTDASSSFMFRDFSGNAKILLDGANGDFSGGDYMEIEADSTPNLMFKQANTERARLNSDGDFLVSTTSGRGTLISATSGGGVAINGNNTYSIFNRQSTNNAEAILILNNTGVDSQMLQFRKDGSTVGSIMSRAGVVTSVVLNPASGTGAGISGGTSAVVPADESTIRDNEISLGVSTHRFKDLYLSGGVYLGGTGASNLLDDYEEGTWAGAIFDAQSGGNQSSSTFTGIYTKIGRKVFFSFGVINVSTSGLTSGNTAYFTLPFTSASSGNNKPTVNALLRDVNWAGSQTSVTSYISDAASRFSLYVQGDNQNYAPILVSEITSGAADFYISGEYTV